MQEMWKEFKFALDLRAGDSKPIPKEDSGSSSSSSSSSSDKTGAGGGGGGSKSLLNEESHYGEIAETPGTPKDRKEESPYATFNEDYGTGKSNKSNKSKAWKKARINPGQTLVWKTASMFLWSAWNPRRLWGLWNREMFWSGGWSRKKRLLQLNWKEGWTKKEDKPENSPGTILGYPTEYL